MNDLEKKLINIITKEDIMLLNYLKLNENILKLMFDIICYYNTLSISDISHIFSSITKTPEEIRLFNRCADIYHTITNDGVTLIFRGVYLIHKTFIANFIEDNELNETITMKDRDIFTFERLMNSYNKESVDNYYREISEIISKRDSLEDIHQLVFAYIRAFQKVFPEYPAVINNPLFKKGQVVNRIVSDIAYIHDNSINNELFSADHEENIKINKLCKIRDSIMCFIFEDLIINSSLDESLKAKFIRSLPNIDDRDLIKISMNNRFLFITDYLLNDIILNFQKEKFFFNETFMIIMSLIVQVCSSVRVEIPVVFSLSLRVLNRDEFVRNLFIKCNSGNRKVSEKYRFRLYTIFTFMRNFIIKLKSSHNNDFKDVIEESGVEYYKLSLDFYYKYKPLYEKMNSTILNDII